MNSRLVYRSQLIEVKIPANTGNPKTKLQLPDVPDLRNTYLLGVETYTNDYLPLSIVTRTPTIDLQLLQSVFLTLQGYDGNNFFSQCPLIDLINVFDANSGDSYNTFPTVFTKQKVNWPKSYIEIANSALINADQDQVVVFNVYYAKFEKAEAVAKKASFKNRS